VQMLEHIYEPQRVAVETQARQLRCDDNDDNRCVTRAASPPLPFCCRFRGRGADGDEHVTERRETCYVEHD
jgi:hypothetical protein